MCVLYIIYEFIKFMTLNAFLPIGENTKNLSNNKKMDVKDGKCRKSSCRVKKQPPNRNQAIAILYA